MPTILLLCEYPTLCGGERSMLSTIDGVRAAGFRVMAAAPPAGPLAEALTRLQVEPIAFSTFGPDGERLPQAALRADLDRLLRRCRPDVLHANSLSMGRLSGPVAAEAGVPSLAHLRDIVRLSGQAIADLNRHRRLLAVSHAVREYHAAAGRSVGPKTGTGSRSACLTPNANTGCRVPVPLFGQALRAAKIHVVYNGVDLARFRPRPPTGCLHAELGLPPAARLVGTIGQICLRKGQDVFVEAAAALATRFPDVHYLIVGTRNSQKRESIEFEAGLRRAAQEGPLAGRLHLLGERDDVRRLLCELTLLVHAARQEPFGRVLLEAAASGIAVAATAVGGTAELFPPQSTAAVLVDPNHPAALAEAMSGLLNDAPRRSALAQAARARAEAAFGLDRAVASLLAHYHEVLA